MKNTTSSDRWPADQPRRTRTPFFRLEWFVIAALLGFIIGWLGSFIFYQVALDQAEKDRFGPLGVIQSEPTP